MRKNAVKNQKFKETVFYMNIELAEAIKTYATKSHKELIELLLGKSKDQLIAIFDDLLTTYITDKNSSTLREFVTVIVAGYKHRPTKIGYNGFRQSTAIGGKTVECEAKPQNINTGENKIRKNQRKLNGGGNFSDYTYERLKKDFKANLNMLVSGFIDGQLIYILEFPFKYSGFVKNLKRRLKKYFLKKKRPGEFLRSAIFTFKNYKNCKELKLVYLNQKALKDNKENLTKNFFAFLEGFEIK